MNSKKGVDWKYKRIIHIKARSPIYLRRSEYSKAGEDAVSREELEF
jgi:hypothetical protein